MRESDLDEIHDSFYIRASSSEHVNLFDLLNFLTHYWGVITCLDARYGVMAHIKTKGFINSQHGPYA